MEGFCRACLLKYNEPTDLIPYSERNRRLFVYSTGLQVKKTDMLTFQLCKDCFLNMKESCRFKKLCRTSDKKFKNYIALKDVEDNIDFCSFLKNNDESLNLKLPLAIGNSTPAYNKNKDDDNESTCTSIRNFMSDILQGEEVPDNEARIIKELFEEEADVLDDTLDSHWLQDEDDMSIATDFRMNYSFSPFSTPRSIENDHCYTPRRINDDIYTHEIKTNRYHDMPILDECAMDIDQVADIPIVDINTNICTINQENNIVNNQLFNKKEINQIISSDEELNSNKHFDLLIKDQVIQIEEIVEDNAIIVKDLLNMEDSTQEFIAPTEIENDFYKIAEQNVTKEVDESIVNNELNYYINKVELRKKNSGDSKCSIDLNLELALQNEKNKEYSLDQLIASPRVSIASGASTPTIRNILFGDLESRSNEKSIENHETKEHSFTDVKKINKLIKKFETASVENLKHDMLDTNSNSGDTVNDIITLIKDEDLENQENTSKTTNVDNIETADLKDFIDDYITNVYENTDANAMNNDELDNLLATVVPGLKVLTDPNTDNIESEKDLISGEEKLEKDVFKKPLPPEDRYDLKQALCKICNKKFGSEQALKIHFSKIHKVKISPRRRQYRKEICNTCGNNFKGKANLIRHMKEVHSETKVRHICKTCSLEFRSYYGLNLHRRIHDDYVPKKDFYEKHLCTYCGKYLSISNYRLHQLKHQNQCNYKCDECNKMFFRKWDLMRHKATHSKDYPYICNFCAKAYKSWEMLKIHMQDHVGRKFTCDDCGAKFKTKSCVRKHLITSECPNKIRKLKVTLDDIILEPMKTSNIKPVTRTNEKSMKKSITKPMEITDVKVKIEHLSIDIEEENFEDISKMAETQVLVTDN